MFASKDAAKDVRSGASAVFCAASAGGSAGAGAVFGFFSFSSGQLFAFFVGQGTGMKHGASSPTPAGDQTARVPWNSPCDFCSVCAWRRMLPAWSVFGSDRMVMKLFDAKDAWMRSISSLR